MAIQQPTAIVQSLRNKTGQTVFYVAYGKTVSRARVVPLNTATPARTRVRTAHADIATYWRDDLAEYQRQAWREAAKLCSIRPTRSGAGALTGWQYFFHVNLTLENIGVGTILDPPTAQIPDPISTLSITKLDASTQTIKINLNGANGPNTHLIVYATGNKGPGQYSANGTTRQIATFGPGATRPLDISAEWTSKFGTLVAGSRVNIQVATANAIDGRLGPRAYATALAEGETDAMQLIQSITLAAAQTPVQFAAIPQTYRHLLLIINAKSDAAQNEAAVYLVRNPSTPYNSEGLRQTVNQSSWSPGEYYDVSAPTIAVIPAANGIAGCWGQAKLFLPNYTDSTKRKTIQAESQQFFQPNNSAYWSADRTQDQWFGADPITEISLSAQYASNFLAGSTFDLYGIT